MWNIIFPVKFIMLFLNISDVLAADSLHPLEFDETENEIRYFSDVYLFFIFSLIILLNRNSYAKCSSKFQWQIISFEIGTRAQTSSNFG